MADSASTAPSPERASQREDRLARERVLLAEGEASYANGDFIADEDLDGWLGRWVAGSNGK